MQTKKRGRCTQPLSYILMCVCMVSNFSGFSNIIFEEKCFFARSMASLPSNLERMIINNGPIQESLLQNLTRWDFRNLQLAGVRISISPEVRRRHQIPTRCDEIGPENAGERCANTTKSFDEIRACEGHPVFDWSVQHNLKKSLGAQEIEPCLRNERFPGWESNPEDEPNTREYPIHTKVCRRCRDLRAGIIARLLDEQLRIADYGRRLCKRHSLEHANQFPINTCHCLDYLNNKWRCDQCYFDTLFYVETRATVLARSLRLKNERIPWSQPWAYLRSLWASHWGSEAQFCPIEGCMQQPWLDETRKERMQLCLGCNAISSI